VSLNYSELARTPSGALTAASKRAIEAERIATAQRMAAENIARTERRELVQALMEASDALEAHDDRQHPDDTDRAHESAETDRERRLIAKAEEVGRVDGMAEAMENAEGTLWNVVTDRIHRMRVLGLDSHMGALDVLDAVYSDLNEEEN